jgi:DNA-binding transcriptional ArsR family regulator
MAPVNSRYADPAEFLAALAHAGRLRICVMLMRSHDGIGVTALAEALGSPQPTVSNALSVLRDQGIVAGERSGKTITYRLAGPRVTKLVHALALAFEL